MAYATAADLVARYPEADLRELTDTQADLIDDVALARALGDASGFIDGYLQGRYVLPLTSVPPVFVQMACEIAFYGLMKGRPEAALKDPKERYDGWVSYLNRVADGRISLAIAADNTTPAENTIAVVEGPQRQFSRGSMRGL